ncbi:serine/threonine-protein kinase ATG1t-like isoform X1 [Citrus sinensis]|nr:serine/threonine-protein kinase ATG1t-like isoform X1 [Citrus sinensis]XP_024036650.1 serine/threonine-protein kinase ATG1t isoform X1 [Citrus x clementina]
MEQNKLSKNKTVGDYALKSKIGESSNSLSTVWKAEHLSSGDVVAVKQVYVEKLNKHLKSCLDCELNFLSSVNHPNIIRLFDAFQAENCIFLVVEFCAGGNLSSYIRLHGRVPEQTARKFLQQLGSSLPAFGAGLEILNSHHIIHRDLKPENILLSGLDDDVMLKIADFGLSCSTLYPGNYAEKVCGSPLYMAPEVLQFQRYDEKVDMWSVGAILFELLNGYPPFSGRNNVQLVRNINSCKHLPFSQLIVPALHPDCVDMCLKLLSANTVDRLSFNEFYHHRFLRRNSAILRAPFHIP